MPDERVTKRRLQSGQACTSCRKRKNRCDGARPRCSNCHSRGINCHYPITVINQLSLEELQACIELKVQEEQNAPHDGIDITNQSSILQSSIPNLINVTQNGNHGSALNSNMSEPVATQLRSSIRPQTGSSSSPIEAEELATGSGSLSPDGSQAGDEYFGESSTFAFVSKVRSSSANRDRQLRRHRGSRASDSRSAVTRDFGESPRSYDSQEKFELPPRIQADIMIDAYFNHVHRLYPFIHEGSFRADYERMWTNQSIFDKKSRLSWFAVLNLIFAYGAEFCNTGSDQVLIPSPSTFMTRARSILFSHVFETATLEMVQAQLLMCHYLQGTLELNACWNLVGLMIRTAISIGLHLNPKSPSMTSVEKEFRKRVWWACFVIDRTISMKFGRPPSIRTADDFDVDLPLNVDDQYIMHDSMLPRQPAGRPSLTAFFLNTIKLSFIIDQILRELYRTNRRPATEESHLYSIRPESNQAHTLGTIVLLDGKLESWWNDIPSNLRDNPDIPDGPDFQRQRNVMLIRFLNLRILLHRQSLLTFSRRENTDPFNKAVAIASSQRAVSAARETIQVIFREYRRRLLNSLWYNLHYVFTAMGVLLYLQSMDESKRESIDQDKNDNSLHLGMQFLSAASSTSTLAARYVKTLRRIQDQPGESNNSNPVPSHDHSTFASNDFENAGDITLTNEPSWMMRRQQTNDALHDWDLTGIDDLLYGTGLPRDLLSTDWQNLEFGM